MRVNIEDDLLLSGRLGRLARTMRWTEREALGALVLFYRSTQDAELVEAPLARIVSVVAAHFDSDSQAESFVRAMAASRLATGSLDGASFLIHGNEPHVLRLRRLRKQASAGGLARANGQSEDSLSVSLATGTDKAPHRVPTQSAPTPSSLLLAPDVNTRSGSPKAKKRNTPSAPVVEQPGFSELVGLWFEGYRGFYGRDPVWTAVHGKQLKNIIAKSSVEELRTLVPLFFKWQRAEVIKAGHSLSTGYASFSQKLDELRADVLNAKRRKQAAIADDVEKNENKQAATVGQSERVAAKFIEEQNARNRTNADGGRNHGPHSARGLDGGDERPEAERRRDELLADRALAGIRRVNAQGSDLGSETGSNAEPEYDHGDGGEA